MTAKRIELKQAERTALVNAVRTVNEYDLALRLARQSATQLITLIRDQHSEDGNWLLSQDGKWLEEAPSAKANQP